jgi:hypothetical protein
VAFTPNALGTQGNSKRRDFYGPGIDNFDMAPQDDESRRGALVELRLEMFNVFNHAQFFGGNSRLTETSAIREAPLVSSRKQPIHVSVRSQQSSGFSGEEGGSVASLLL